LTVAIVAFLFVPCANGGQSGDYVGASTGMLFTRDNNITDREGSIASLTYDSIGIPVSAFIGHQFGDGLRVEEEGVFRRDATTGFTYSGVTSALKSNVWSLSAMTNLYFDWFHNLEGMENDVFSPYVGLGVGIADVNLSEGVVNGLKLWNGGSDVAFAYQLIIGNSAPINKELFVDISYRYFATQNVNIDTIKTPYNNQDILLGVRYLFR
jgi:opacity protein-like surface antigen